VKNLALRSEESFGEVGLLLSGEGGIGPSEASGFGEGSAELLVFLCSLWSNR
jgi:hypothetical protein